MNNKKLILDYSIWRSGSNGDFKIGRGLTSLKNSNGFMCCIGQWCEQSGIPENFLFNVDHPSQLRIINPLFNELHQGYTLNTSFSSIAIDINDNPETPPDEKIKLLTEHLASYSIELQVINKPK